MRYARGRWKRHRIEYLPFAVHKVEVAPKNTHKVYRRRFGIESSYKLMGMARRDLLQEPCAKAPLRADSFPAGQTSGSMPSGCMPAPRPLV